MGDLGYDPLFLDTAGEGRAVEPPEPADAVLDYEHFTVRMHPTRRLAWWVAWNIDGLRLFPGEDISRSGERFRLDPRLPAEQQTGEGAYAANDLDRGHLARRSDLLWGTLEEALRANSDSFHFTNIAPQRSGFNQSGRGGTWGLLENAVLELDGLEERRVSVLAGPVLADDDPPYRDLVQLPAAFWKVVVYRLDGQLTARAFLLTQSLDGIEPAFLDDFDTWMVPLELLEERTGLAFDSLRALGVTTDQVEPPVLVDDARQVPW